MYLCKITQHFWQWLEEDFLGYLKEWEESVMARQGFTLKEKKNMLLSQETLLGIKITGKANFYAGMHDCVFSPSFSSILY